MSQHNNFKGDLTAMSDAYSQVRGSVPKPFTTAAPRMIKESRDEGKLESIELGGKLYEVGLDDPNDDGLVINIEKHPNGYFITGGVYSEPEDFVNDPENPREGYGYALTLDGQPMDEDDLEDGLGHEDAEGAEDTVKVSLELELDKETAEQLHSQLMDEVVPAEDSSCASHSDEEHSEDAEGHHSSGSDDGECDECGGDGCNVCNGSGEQDEEEVVAESYTARYLLK